VRTNHQTVAAGHSVEVDPARWQALLEELLGRVAGRFARADLRRRARAFVGGLLADLPRKNCWTLAEHAGDANPDGMQHLLARAGWDHDKVRDDLRDYVVEHLGEDEAVLVVDETGDLKKGTRPSGSSAGTPAPPGASRTPRSGSTWCTPAAAGTR
jgi:DDE superfamily endonuclease